MKITIEQLSEDYFKKVHPDRTIRPIYGAVRSKFTVKIRIAVSIDLGMRRPQICQYLKQLMH
jgi:hypothetical protein